MSGAAAATQHQLLRRLALSNWAGIATGVLCALILAITADLPFPTRDVGAELRMFLLTYPLTYLLARRMTRVLPAGTRAMVLAVFLLAVLVRVAVLCYITPVALATREYFGAFGDDTAYYTVLARMYSRLITGSDYNLAVELRQSVGHLSMASGMEAERLTWPNFTMLLGAATALAGYSVVAIAIPMVMASSLIPVIVFMFLIRVYSTKTAMATLMWTAFSSNYIFFGICANKESITVLVIVCTLSLASCRRSGRSLRTWISVGLLALVSTATRDQLLFVVLGLLGFSQIYWRLPDARRKGAVGLLVGLAVLATGNPLRALVALVLNSAAVPALSWCFTPWTSMDFERMFQTPTAIVWPLIAGLGLVGVIAQGLGNSPRTRLVLASGLCVLVLIASENIGTMTAARHRLAVEWLLVAYAMATVDVLQTMRPKLRAMMVQWAFAGTALLIIAHLAYALLKG